MEYEVRYWREDGSFGAYNGTSREAFEIEVNNCIRLGYKFIAEAKEV